MMHGLSLWAFSWLLLHLLPALPQHHTYPNEIEGISQTQVQFSALLPICDLGKVT